MLPEKTKLEKVEVVVEVKNFLCFYIKYKTRKKGFTSTTDYRRREKSMSKSSPPRATLLFEEDEVKTNKLDDVLKAKTKTVEVVSNPNPTNNEKNEVNTKNNVNVDEVDEDTAWMQDLK